VIAPLRKRLALALAALSIAVAAATVAAMGTDSGVHVRVDATNRVLVAEVREGSRAWSRGLRAGMVVVSLGEVTLLQLPASVYPAPDPLTGDVPWPRTPIGVEPAAPTVVPLDATALERLLAQPVRSIAAIAPGDLAAGSADRWRVLALFEDDRAVWAAWAALIVGTATLIIVAWWLARGRGGERLRRLALPLAVGATTPIIVAPLEGTGFPLAVGAAGIVTALAMVPLALSLIERIEDPAEARLVARLVGLSLAGAVGVAVFVALVEAGYTPVRWVFVALLPLLPGLAAAAPARSSSGLTSSTGRVLEASEYAVAGATPLFGLLTAGWPYLFPLWFWLGLLLLAGRFTIRPLARLATRAQLQRDLAVAAAEAERARVAADIHDDALQELTLLVARLDAAGDVEGADIARTVADRLRAICGDLRLPILDDLGLGPALDWLVLRIERLAGGEVRLERSEASRPPAAVELAFFRIAQEALANAVKHGAPPILVRYTTLPAGASLSIDDAGSGIAPEATAEAEQAGRFGLLNMAERAAAIGAILDVRRGPAGGTHVGLVWRAQPT
jgi:signal transduction histidine kinase